MFNFFSEIKDKCGELKERVLPYQIVMIGGQAMYVEGDISVMTIGSENVVFKVSGDIIIVNGRNLGIKEMAENTLILVGKILSWECV